MRKIILTTIVLTGIIVPLTIFGEHQAQKLFAGCQFQSGSLENKSTAEIEKTALDYACTNFKSTEPPRVRLNRMISPKEYMTFFGGTTALCKGQELALVILEGDFESVNVLGMRPGPASAKFIGLLFDLKSGKPTSIMGSKTGEGFAEILNDMNLPPRTSRLTPPPKKLRECTYGQIAPTAMPPNH